jgi:galactokinase/mevalonate kinase-like predicted kinase
LCRAGGGGYMLFFCPPLARHNVANALTKAGAVLTNFGFDDGGLQTWVAKGAASGAEQ